jgi:hypothetical protein
MPVANFPEYARAVSDVIMEVVGTGQARLVNLQIDQRSTLRGYIAGIMAFANDSQLHFREFIDTTQTECRIMYVYHYQDASNTLIFRYDNALHRPPLAQREHKHTPTEIQLKTPPTLAQVIDEILNQ